MNKLLITYSKINKPAFLFSSFIHKNQIAWQNKYGGVFIRFPIQRYRIYMLFFAHQQMKFKHLATGMKLDASSFTFPEGVDIQSNILDFLRDWKTPKKIQIIYQGRKKILKNKACQEDSVLVMKTVKNPKSIYGGMFNYVMRNPSEVTSSSDINYYLKHFYLRLSAQTYCLIHQINKSAKMTPQIGQKILDFIGEQYQNTSPAQLKKLHTSINLVQNKIQITKQQIKKIQSEGSRAVNLYKYGAIFITAVHIATFAFMIFYVDWLGWDIIEPLTYTVGVFYTLLGIRFYKKYRADRVGENIREVLMKATMKPKKLIQLKQIKYRLDLHKKQLKRLECKSRILKNRINFRSSLCDSLKGNVQI